MAELPTHIHTQLPMSDRTVRKFLCFHTHACVVVQLSYIYTKIDPSTDEVILSDKSYNKRLH